MARGKQAITGFKAGRTIALLGTVYAAGQAIPNAVVAGIRNASSLLSRRWIVPDNEQYPNHRNLSAAARAKPTPTTLGARERRDLGA